MGQQLALPMPVAEEGSAVISPCGRYRWLLGRRWREGAGICCWVMLNPSVADATDPDPTIRRCMAFARSWDMAGIDVVNLYGWRATDPRVVRRMLRAGAGPDPVGDPATLDHLIRAVLHSALTVVAWGRNAGSARVIEVMDRLDGAGALWCLGRNKGGSPKHPLYLAADTKLVPYGFPKKGYSKP